MSKTKAAKKSKKSKKDNQTSDQKAMGERNRIALAFMELAKDKTFQKLSEEQKINLVQEVLGIGDEVASWVEAEYSCNDPRKIAAQLGVKVFGADGDKKKRSEYRKETKEIVIYREFHEKLLREISTTELSEHLLKFIVAHELFHHLELDRIGEVYKRFKFPAWKIGPFLKEKQIPALSNVAAQAFTQTLLKLQISPQIFDYLTYIMYTRP